MDTLDLLRMEAAALLARTGPGGGQHRQLVVMSTSEGLAAMPAPGLPGPLAGELARLVSQAAPQAATQAEVSAVPPVVAACRHVLEGALGRSSILDASGPSYLVTDGGDAVTTTTIVCSGSVEATSLREANPGNWETEEWDRLVAGALGPWAMATDGGGGGVVSLCHTSLLVDQVAEAGTWTHPDHRGKGLAAATTAAWASVVRPVARFRFYSTSFGNSSSQGVARRLGFPLLGALWWLG